MFPVIITLCGEFSILSSKFHRDRRVHEIDFTDDQSLKLGRFDAFDYFGDGSFYLLNSPGVRRASYALLTLC